MDRRSVIKLLGLSTMAPTLFQSALANVDSADKRFLVVLNIPGGWDTTLGLDPWTESKAPDSLDLFLEYNPCLLYTSPSPRD